MKKVKFLTTIFLLAQLMLNAQIVLEHTFTVPYRTYPVICKLATNGEKWFIMDRNNDKFFLYNLDYTLYKEINVPVQPNHYYWVSNISEKLFDLDESLEYMVTDYTFTFVKIYNEDGSLMFSEGDSVHNAISANIYSTANGTKMHIQMEHKVTGDNQAKIYSLVGVPFSTPSERETTNSELCTAQAFPNPNDGQTNIAFKLPLGDTKGQLVFYNLQGEVVKTLTVDRQSGCIKIDNSNLPSGIYLYQVTAENNSSEMKKLIIN